MAPNEPDSIHGHGRNNEEDFFRREDQRLLERLRSVQVTASLREALSMASGITNPAVLDKLTALEIRSEMIAALSVVPLVEVAWADGSLDPKERASILEIASEKGFGPGTMERVLLETWLEKRPEPRLFAAWTHFVEGLCEKLPPAEIARLRSTLLERAQKVARASGGVLGLGSKVSKAEADVLGRLEKAFRPAT